MNNKKTKRILIVLGLFTIMVGALLALAQKNFKRVAAYSSVSQMGYLLLGLAADTRLGLIAALLYLLINLVLTMFAGRLEKYFARYDRKEEY